LQRIFSLTDQRSLGENSIELFNQIGAVKNIQELNPENQLRGNFEIVGETGKINVFFTLTPENPALIQELQMSIVK
jgi:hypothetical protein